MRIHPQQSALIVCTLVLIGTCASSARASDKKAILEQANKAYYNLKARGLAEFRCTLVPDWDTAFSGMKTDAVGRDQVLLMAKQAKFEVTIGPTGAASVSHQFSQAPPSEEVAERLRQLSEGVDQMLSGFFQTWSQLMMNPPPPGTDAEYQLEEWADGYRFTADESNTHVAVLMNREFLIDSIEAKLPDLEGIVRPQFSRHNGALVLDSYQATFKTKDGNSQQLSAKIHYQEVEGFTLPRIVTLSMPIPQGHVDWPVEFADCRVKKSDTK